MNRIWDTLLLFRPGGADLVEILLVSALIYRLLLLIHRTRAMQMLLGVLLLASVFLLAQLLGFQLIERILETLFQYGAIAALVIFQPELRSALARLGQSRMLRPFTRLEESQVADEVVAAVEQLTRAKVGAIIAIEQEVALDEYAEAASRVDAPVTSAMLSTIFTPYSPLHDGAVLLAGGQIRCAGAILPLTQYPLADRSLGTRHRAALGLSEESDAIVIVVSEETSRVSVARAGRLERDVSSDRLREILAQKDEAATPALPGRLGGLMRSG